jgi:hypothetical protein
MGDLAMTIPVAGAAIGSVMKAPRAAQKMLKELSPKEAAKVDFSTLSNKTEAFENEPVSSIREQWIGGVSGLGDRAAAYDLPYVQGGPQYQQQVRDTLQDSLGDRFKGYRLMHKEELEELQSGAMGTQLASFSLDKKTAESFANLAAYRRANPDDLVVVEMDLTPNHVWMMGKPGEKELVVDYGVGYNPNALDVSPLPSKAKKELNELIEQAPAPTAPVVRTTATPAVKKWFGNSKAVDSKGEPLVLYRGLVGGEVDPFSGRAGYAIFTSDNPYIASSYSGDSTAEFGVTGGVVTPMYAKVDSIIEFPLDKNGSLDKFEFDRRAKTLKPGESLVARNAMDTGPRMTSAMAEGVTKRSGDIWAFANGTEFASALSPTAPRATDQGSLPTDQGSLPTETKEFKNWAGDLPIYPSFKEAASDRGVFKLYHATPEDFQEFVLGGKSPKESGKAIWLSPDPSSTSAAFRVGSESRGFKEGANIRPVYTKIARPLVIDDKPSMEWAQTVYGESQLFPQVVSDDAIKRIKEDGYDSVVFKGEQLGWGKGSDEILAFEQDQIKSAFDPAMIGVEREVNQ